MSADVNNEQSGPRRVLVTGASGRLGRAMLDDLAARGVAMVATDRVDPGDLAAERIVIGDLGDPDVAREAVRDVDAVLHFAAIPTPVQGTPKEVFVGNAAATFVVLEEAAAVGVRRAAFASSFSVTGLPWAERILHPAYVPVDEDLPLQVADPYALSKQADEATGSMMALRYGMTTVALRYPFMSSADVIEGRAKALAADPSGGVKDLWSYLDLRDAARAAWLAITRPLTGFHIIFLAAPRVLAPQPTEDLLTQFHPDVPRRDGRPVEGREVPIDLRRARELLGFEAEYLFD